MLMKSIKSLRWDLTSNCKIKCAACLRNKYGHKTIDGLSEIDSDYYDIIFQELKRRRILEIQFLSTWGDPLYHQDFLDIIKRLSQNDPGTIIKIYSSLEHGDEEFYKELGEHLNKFYRVDIITNVYGTETSHATFRKGGSFDNVTKHSEILSKFDRVNVTWKMFVGDWNEVDVKQVYDTSCSIGIFKFIAQNIFHEILVKDDVSEIFLKPSETFEEFDDDMGNMLFNFSITNDKYACDSIKGNYIYLDPWGYVWPCVMVGQYTFHEGNEGALIDDAFEDYGDSFNNIYDHDLDTILKHKWFREALEDTWDTKSPCEICKNECGVDEV